jgi:hypothetical protein
MPRECDQKFYKKWRKQPSVASETHMWLLSQMLITCRMLRESVGSLALAPDSSAEEAFCMGKPHLMMELTRHS